MALRNTTSRAFFLAEFQDYFYVTAAVEAAHGAGGGGQAVVFGVDLVVHVGIQAAEAIVPRLVGNVGLHGLRFHVLEVDNA